MRVAALLAVPLSLAVAGPAFAAPLERPIWTCEVSVAKTLATCTTRVQTALRSCYRRTGAPCVAGSAGQAAIDKTLGAIAGKIDTGACRSTTLNALAYGAQTQIPDLAARLATACRQQATSLAARAFGGPHAAVLAASDAATGACLDATYVQGAKFTRAILKAHKRCLVKDHARGACDVVATEAAIARASGKAEAAIAARCPDLPAVVGLSPSQFLARTAAQARCATATAFTDTGPLDLDCGPRPAVPVPPRGEWVRVQLDQATTGTRCGDGSDYAFWLRLAPSGSPLAKVATDMEGGGVCIFESDCLSASPSLFAATDGEPDGGYLSTNPAVNPFSERTMLYLPYCTQDVHIGGGATSVFPGITVHRYGGLNVRAALAYLRDVLWAAMDESEPEGWQPDQLEVFFAGESAGGFGVQYNYHWMLDELGWAQTTSVPDSALALDNGGPVSVAVLGALISGDANPFGWNVRPMLPPYCQAGNCGVGPILQNATVPRLAGPFQQFLNLSNQVDSTQVGTTFFSGTVPWVNAMRASYCAQAGTPGIRYFLPAVAASIHTMLRDDTRFTTLSADGVSVRDFVAAAMANPAGVVDRVDEGAGLGVAYPGVAPFPCAVD